MPHQHGERAGRRAEGGDAEGDARPLRAQLGALRRNPRQFVRVLRRECLRAGFYLILLAGVLLITYIPALTMAPLAWMGREGSVRTALGWQATTGRKSVG